MEIRNLFRKRKATVNMRTEEIHFVVSSGVAWVSPQTSAWGQEQMRSDQKYPVFLASELMWAKLTAYLLVMQTTICSD